MAAFEIVRTMDIQPSEPYAAALCVLRDLVVITIAIGKGPLDHDTFKAGCLEAWKEGVDSQAKSLSLAVASQLSLSLYKALNVVDRTVLRSAVVRQGPREVYIYFLGTPRACAGVC